MTWKTVEYFVKRYYPLGILLLAFGALYSLISFYNHWNFRTGTHMIGPYLNAMYDYIRFSFNDMSTLGEIRNNLLAKEFDLYLILFSPLSLIPGTYTLLAIQILAILLGGIGVYRYLLLISDHTTTPTFGTLFFFSFFGIFSALYADYHSAVIASMLIPWFFYYFKTERYGRSIFLIFLLLIANQKMGLFLSFVLLGMIFDYYKDKNITSRLVTFALLSYLYFMIIEGLIAPALSNVKGHPVFEYHYVSENMMGVLKFALKHPFSIVKFLLVNHTGNPEFDDLKKEFLIFILLSGGFLLFFRFRYLIMVIPLFFIMLLNDNPEHWSVYSYHCALFAPIFSIGIFDYIDKLSKRRYRLFAAAVVLVIGFILSFLLMENTVVPGQKEKIALHKKSHYQRVAETDSMHMYFEKIPHDAAVSAQADFLPHLAKRDNIYAYPLLQNAEYIVVSENLPGSPLKSDERMKLELIKEAPSWDTLVYDNGFYIFKNRLLEEE